ncbi:hypothetical protein E2C01_072698 [Portunus trituberculatus]|uniref:Uncharacterized protein n=1 Tax=Portunus trituberculatus TaxID=210409 RepID=A0A5B7I7V6_PORTR|nr:hypothetical protein [Portunus trituberculatus]
MGPVRGRGSALTRSGLSHHARLSPPSPAPWLTSPPLARPPYGVAG